MRSTAWTLLAVAVAGALVMPTLFGAVGPADETASHATAQDVQPADPEALGNELQLMLAALPEPLSPVAALGPAAHWLFEAGSSGSGLRDPPGSMTGVFDRVRHDAPFERLPVPHPPEGPEPLLSAIDGLGRTLDIGLPAKEVLRAQVAGLRLQPEAEQALARLVLAYSQAVELEARAVAGLSPGQQALVARDPAAVAAALGEHGTPDELQEHIQRLSSRVDISPRLQAADLLMRTIELTKGPIGLPPVALAAPGAVAAPHAQDVAEQVLRAGGPAWQKVYLLVDPGHADLPEFPEESLLEALQKLAAVLGAPGAELPPVDHLPPSLASALAGIVTARRVGLESGDPGVHTRLLLDATREAEPALRAWAALLRLSERAPAPARDVPALLEVAMAPGPSPIPIITRGAGTTPAPPAPLPIVDADASADAWPSHGPAAPAATTLASLLVREGVPPAEAQQVAVELPALVATAMIQTLHALQAAQAAQQEAMGALSADERSALGRGPPLGLLAQASWSPAEAASVEAWALAVQQVAQAPRSMRDSQIAAVAATAAAVDALRPYVQAAASAPSPGLPAIAASSHGPFDCPANLPGSDCSQDVWFSTAAGRGILVTGFEQTVVGPALMGSNPGLVIDLGGDDEYLHAVGAADASSGASSRILVELGGDDQYGSQARLAHGAAHGPGALGVVWDVAGSDTYRHDCLDASLCFGSQGFGSNGGLGVLVDEAGHDTYDAPDAWAHGVGLDDSIFPPPTQSNGLIDETFVAVQRAVQVAQNAAGGASGAGVLVDGGVGGDDMTAGRGQGYASGDGTLGVLVNAQGANRYETVRGDARFQGGHGVGHSAIGMLVDLGGHGTVYSNQALPAADSQSLLTYIGPDAGDPLRVDDALWVEQHTDTGETQVGFGSLLTVSRGIGIGIGLDTVLDDEDGDGHHNPVEMLAGSDPSDAGDSPDPSAVEEILAKVDEILDDPPDDPDDVQRLLEGHLFRDRSLCSDASCGQRMSILHVSGTGDGTHDERAMILIELGGDDTYTTEVAGPGHYFLPGIQERLQGPGSYALDLGGSDHYATPGLSGTQGAVDLYLAGRLLGACTADPLADPEDCWLDEYAHSFTPVSMLLDRNGDDVYEADEWSQAAVRGMREEPFLGTPGSPTVDARGAAWLIDLSGNDTYTAGAESQAMAENSASAGLIDIAGDDLYTFSMQAWGRPTNTLHGDTTSVLFDGGGRDVYDATAAPVVYDGTEASAFAVQGVGSGPSNLFQFYYNVGVFVDHGLEHDRYLMLDADGGVVDVSSIKNNRTRPSPHNDGGLFSDSAAWFANPADPDGDGAPVWAEYVSGTDPDDGRDHPGVAWNGTTDPLTAAALLRIPGHLAVFGRGDSVVREPYGLLISLGGDDTYTAPNVGGVLASRGTHLGPVHDDGTDDPVTAVQVVLDAGAGDDRYFPDPAACRITGDLGSSRTVSKRALCPSLGAALTGIAIVADDGGKNHFRTEAEVDATAGGPWEFDLVTQGASGGSGAVGILSTWDASNRFEAVVRADMRQRIPILHDLELRVRGVAQGASLQGLGLLASFGAGADTYLVDLDVQGGEEPVVMALSQGAMAPPHVRFPSGLAMLIDGGGANLFSAPSGSAQGFNGFLWSGTGEDRFVGGPFSQGGTTAVGLEQGAGNEGGGLASPSYQPGFLYDAGGSDTYEIRGAGNGIPSYSQGAALGSVGILVDAAGDDRYLAPGATAVQGAATHGYGMLLDLGGHDIYEAAGRAQGYASDAVTDPLATADGLAACIEDADPLGSLFPPGVPGCLFPTIHSGSASLLLDLHGNDAYAVDGPGQGLAEAADCATATALFIDASGTDRYRHGGTKTAVGAVGQGAKPGNDWAWTQSEGVCPATAGSGIDSGHLDLALAAVPPVAGLQSVGLQVRSGDTIVPDGGLGHGVLTLRALVQVTPQEPSLVRRVSFFQSAGDQHPQVLGEGSLMGSEGGNLVYELDWDTAAGAVPDDAYDVWVSAFLDTAAGRGAGAVGTPDGWGADSETTTVLVDNPAPLLATMAGTTLSSAHGSHMPIDLRLGPDLAWPAVVDRDAVCQSFGIPLPDCRPGGFVQVHATQESTQHGLFAQPRYHPAGEYTLHLAARDGADPWGDGLYPVVAEAQDGRWTVQQELEELLVDGTPPASWITLPTHAGTVYQGTGGTLRLAWEHTDGAGAGVQEVCVFRLDSEGVPMASDAAQEWPQCLAAETRTLAVGAVETGADIWLATVARDAAGNDESTCLPGESVPCVHAKIQDGGIAGITVDFAPPVISEVQLDGGPASQTHVAPGDPVEFTATVADVGTAVDRVTIRLPGGLTAEMADGGDGVYRYGAWHEHNTLLHDVPMEQEYPFAVTAWDEAGNAPAPSQHWGVLDSLPPRVRPLGQETYYVADGEGTRLPSGRGGSEAFLTVLVQDLAVASLALDATQVAAAPPTCTAPPAQADLPLWTCRFRLQDLPDGDYRVPITAVDAAGNRNTTEHARIEVRNQPPEIQGLRILETTHDGFTVAWSTPFNATGTVEYGRTSRFGQQVSQPGFRTDHVLDVAGLAPSSRYFFRAVSENTAGVPNNSSLLHVTTASAYEFAFETDAGTAVSGVRSFPYRLDFRAGQSPVHVEAMLQDAASAASPFNLASFDQEEGSASLTLDTQDYADGDYLLVFELDRLGDFQRVESPVFRIDNTLPVVVPESPRPAAIVAAASPLFEVALLEPMGRTPPILETLEIRDGAGTQISLSIQSDEVAGDGLLRRVAFTIPAVLATGTYEFIASVEDEAGNRGTALWPFQVDVDAPTLVDAPTVVADPGPQDARPGGAIDVTVRLADGAGVAAATLDLSPLLDAETDQVPLLAGEDAWKATVAVPAGSAHGDFMLPVTAVDAVGNAGVVGHVEVTVDAQVPQVGTIATTHVGYVDAVVEFATDEPAMAWTGRRAPAAGSSWNTSHVLHLGGLAPGQEQSVPVSLVDRAGNGLDLGVVVTTLADVEAPGRVAGLQASSGSEGEVVLSWTPATDNAGVGGYRVTRSAAPRAEPLEATVDGHVTMFRDTDAPAGRTVTYRIAALDVAGQAGPAAAVEVEVLAKPHLLDASITPLQGSADEPFTFEVLYRHAGDRPPDALVVQVGQQRHDLVRASEDACSDGCLYRAEIRLPSSSLFGAVEEATFIASTAGHEARLTHTDVPFVLGAGDVVDVSSHERATPGPGPFLLALALFAAFSLLRRRHP